MIVLLSVTLDLARFADRAVNICERNVRGEFVASNCREMITRSTPFETTSHLVMIRGSNMIDIHRVLCPVDFSHHAEVAAVWGRDLANRYGAELHLLHVVACLEPYIPPGMAALGEELVAKTQRASLARLEEVAGGGTAVRRLREGDPADEIAGYARESRIDLIVMATHGRTGLSHIVIGSVAERVVRHASCAVLTIRPDADRFAEV